MDFIQRLTILHLNLAQLSIGRELEESASDEELMESILYDRITPPLLDDPNHDWGGGVHGGAGWSMCLSTTTTRKKHSAPYYAASALQFAGLCKALYLLPRSLDPDKDQDLMDSDSSSSSSLSVDRMQEVHLDQYTLVFERLEDPHIIAVAQVAAAAHSRRASSSLCVDHHRYSSCAATRPIVAVRSALRRAHQLFRLLRGGGILRRLLQEHKDNHNHNHHYYAGMQQLYTLRKQARTLREKREREGGLKGEEETMWMTVEVTLNDLCLTLPITSIRDDLRIHYDTLLLADPTFEEEDSSTTTTTTTTTTDTDYSTSGPSMTMDDDCSAPAVDATTPFCLPLSLSSRLSPTLQAFFKQETIATAAACDNDDNDNHPRIIAMSVFAQGWLVTTETADDGKASRISAEEAHQIFGYMSNVRSKMTTLSSSVRVGGGGGDCFIGSRRTTASAVAVSTNNSRPKKKKYTPLSVSFGNDLVEEESGVRLGTVRPLVASNFMPPPPLSLLSASDTASQDFQGPRSGTRVWAPRFSFDNHHHDNNVHVNGSDSVSSIKDYRVCMYVPDPTNMRLSFLLYIRCPAAIMDSNNMIQDDDTVLSELLQKFEDSILPTLVFEEEETTKMLDNDEQRITLTTFGSRWMMKPSVDAAILIDRTHQWLTLFSRASHGARPPTTAAVTNEPPRVLEQQQQPQPQHAGSSSTTHRSRFRFFMTKQPKHNNIPLLSSSPDRRSNDCNHHRNHHLPRVQRIWLPNFDSGYPMDFSRRYSSDLLKMAMEDAMMELRCCDHNEPPLIDDDNEPSSPAAAEGTGGVHEMCTRLPTTHQWIYAAVAAADAAAAADRASSSSSRPPPPRELYVVLSPTTHENACVNVHKDNDVYETTRGLRHELLGS